MYNVTWYAAEMFAAWVGARLPQEAEWEYAGRAREKTRYCNGDTEDDLKKVAWYAGNAKGHPWPVGQKAANAFKLHDMHGNVWEWCLDAWDPEAYAQRAAGVLVEPKSASSAVVGQSAAENPANLADPVAGRVVRGGSWNNNAVRCRAAYRNLRNPWNA